MNPILLFILSIIIISSVQWICIQLLANYCTSYTLTGFLTNFINLGSPICSFINNIQLALNNHYITMWTGVFTSIILHYGLKK